MAGYSNLPSGAPGVVIGGEASVHSLITRLPFELPTTRFTSFSDSRKVTCFIKIIWRGCQIRKDMIIDHCHLGSHCNWLVGKVLQ